MNVIGKLLKYYWPSVLLTMYLTASALILHLTSYSDNATIVAGPAWILVGMIVGVLLLTGVLPGQPGTLSSL